MKRFLAFIAAAFFATAAYGQNPGTVTNHAFVIGKGAGVVGYGSALCTSAQIAVGQAAADPICRTVTGDWTLSAAGVATLGTVNANVGSFGSATQCISTTVNAKGLITAMSAATCTPAIGSITGLGANVATALGVGVGSAGAFVTFNGALGTPSSGVGTNLTGTAAGLTAGTVTTNANLTGPVTSVGNATTITANAVTRAMQAQGIARSVIGVTGNATANVADIQGTANQVLVVNPAGTALTFGALRLDGGAASLAGLLPAASLSLSQITNSLGADVLMTPTSTFKDGPSIAQGTTGTWFASGTVTIIDPTNVNGRIFCKLWDGTTAIASGAMITPNVATTYATMSLSGFIASPAANIRISCENLSFTTASIAFNQTGSSKDSTITAFRIN